jgi:hypothetical protein
VKRFLVLLTIILNVMSIAAPALGCTHESQAPGIKAGKAAARGTADDLLLSWYYQAANLQEEDEAVHVPLPDLRHYSVQLGFAYQHSVVMRYHLVRNLLRPPQG